MLIWGCGMKTKVISITIDDAQLQRVDRIASDMGKPRSQIIGLLLADALDGLRDGVALRVERLRPADLGDRARG
jgi:metal-responsive CopG/Arc/MetJ family transcriptional regulator